MTTAKNNLIILYEKMYMVVSPLIDGTTFNTETNNELKGIIKQIKNNKHFLRLPNKKRLEEIYKINNTDYFLCECGVYIKKSTDNKYGKNHINTTKHSKLMRNKRIVYFKKNKYITPEIEREVNLDHFIKFHLKLYRNNKISKCDYERERLIKLWIIQHQNNIEEGKGAEINDGLDLFHPSALSS